MKQPDLPRPPSRDLDLDIEDNIPEEGEALEDSPEAPADAPPSAVEIETSHKRERSKSPSSDRGGRNQAPKDESPPRRRRDSQSSERALKRQRVERWRKSGEAGEASDDEALDQAAEPGEASDDSPPRASRPAERRPSANGSQRSRSAASTASSDLNSLEAELLGRPVRRQSSGSSAPKTKVDNAAPTQSALQSLGPIKKKRKPTDSAYRYVYSTQSLLSTSLTKSVVADGKRLMKTTFFSFFSASVLILWDKHDLALVLRS